jgi:ERCC4-type nuclease
MPKRKPILPFTISIDDREKHPYDFSRSEVVHMETGDYGIVEAPLLITIDRKNPNDAVQTVIANRARFVNEMERMQEYRFRAIIIEATLETMLQPYRRSRANPRSVVQSYMAFQVRYNVHVIWAGNRKLARATTFRLLEWAWYERCKEMGLI